MPTLLERLAKLKGEAAPAAVPTPLPAPPKLAEYASAMPDVKKELVGKVTKVEDETGVTFIAPYVDEIEWEKLHKQFGAEHKGWVLNISRRVVDGKGERVAFYLRPEAAPPSPAVKPEAPVAAVLAPVPRKFSERIRAMAAAKEAPPAPPAPTPAPVAAPPVKVVTGAVEQMRARLQAMPLEGLKAMYEASRTLPMAIAEKKLLIEEAERRGIIKIEAPAPEPERHRVEHVTPEEMEEMRKRLKGMSAVDFKEFFDMAGQAELRQWERMILLDEAERRGMFKEAPKKVEEARPAGLVEYGQFLVEGKPDKEKFKVFMTEWGLKLDREDHRAVAQRVWEKFLEKKALPAWDELAAEDKNFIYRNYMGRLKERYGEPLEIERVRRGYKSMDELVGDIWQRYGRRWVRVPPAELGLGEYPGGVSAQEWHQNFLSFVMRSPYLARPKRAQELYNQYGIFGKMPPLSEFVFPAEIAEAVAKGEEPSDADAVVRLYNEANRPLTEMDLSILFEGKEDRIKRAYQLMHDYTEDHFKNEVYRMVDEMVKSPAGQEKLKFIALTDSKKIFADLVQERDPKFQSSVPAFSDLAYDTLLDYLPKMLPVEERGDIIDVQVEQNYNEKRRAIEADMERIRPSWGDIQVIGQQKNLIERWKRLRTELGRPITAMDFYMRYPDVPKGTSRSLEVYNKFDDIKKLWEDKIPSKEQIEVSVPALLKRIAEYKPAGVKVEEDKNKVELEKDVLLLDRLNDLYMYQTEKPIVEKLDVGNILRAASLVDAKEFARNIYKPEWLGEAEFTRVAALIKEKKRVPTEEDLFKEFGDSGIVRAVMALFADNKVSPKIKLTEDTIREIATFKGLEAGEVEQAVAAFRGSGEFPLNVVEKKKLEGLKERQKAVQRFLRVVAKAVPKEVKGRLEEIKALGGAHAVRLQKYTDLIMELESRVVESNKRVAELEKQKAAALAKGTKQMQEAAEAELMEAEEERNALYASLSAARHERLAFIRTPPRIDYTRGQAEIDHEMYVTRTVEVKGQEVLLTLEDIHRFWVEPVEAVRKEFMEKKKEEPTAYELAELEPSVDKILAEEKAGKRVADKEKKIATIVLMNYARELGAYPFEYEMAKLAKDLGVKDVPLFALPAQSTEARSGQFMEWLRFGLTRREIERWEPHVHLAFIGDDWKECKWDGDPKKLEDVAGQKVHLRDCAILKAKAAQAVALQTVEPRVLQPIIVEAVEGAPPSPELMKLVEENERLEKELATKTEQLATAMAFGTEAKKKLTQVAELEAKIAGMEQRMAAPAVAAEGKRLIIRRRPTAEEVEGERKRKETIQKELTAELGEEKTRAVEKELAGKMEELTKLAKKIEQERMKARGVCFSREGWDLIKMSISEHLASNRARLSDIQERLTASRSAGLATGISAYERELETLKDEAQVLDEVVGYIRTVEREKPDKFLCAPGE